MTLLLCVVVFLSSSSWFLDISFVSVLCLLWPVACGLLFLSLFSVMIFFFLLLLLVFVVVGCCLLFVVLLLLSYYLLQILHLFLIVVRPVGEEKKDKGSAMGMDFVCVELHCCTASATNYKCGTQRYGNF